MPPEVNVDVVTSEIEPEEKKMPATFDLPENMGAAIASEVGANITHDNRQGRAISNLAGGVLMGALGENFHELGVKESRANSGLIATPIASPTNGADK